MGDKHSTSSKRLSGLRPPAVPRGVGYSRILGGHVRLVPRVMAVEDLTQPLPRVVVEDEVLGLVDEAGLNFVLPRMERAAQASVSETSPYVYRHGPMLQAAYELTARPPGSPCDLVVLFFVRFDEPVRRITTCWIDAATPPGGGCACGPPSGTRPADADWIAAIDIRSDCPSRIAAEMPPLEEPSDEAFPPGSIVDPIAAFHVPSPACSCSGSVATSSILRARVADRCTSRGLGGEGDGRLYHVDFHVDALAIAASIICCSASGRELSGMLEYAMIPDRKGCAWDACWLDLASRRHRHHHDHCYDMHHHDYDFRDQHWPGALLDGHAELLRIVPARLDVLEKHYIGLFDAHFHDDGERVHPSDETSHLLSDDSSSDQRAPSFRSLCHDWDRSAFSLSRCSDAHACTPKLVAVVAAVGHCLHYGRRWGGHSWFDRVCSANLVREDVMRNPPCPSRTFIASPRAGDRKQRAVKGLNDAVSALVVRLGSRVARVGKQGLARPSSDIEN